VLCKLTFLPAAAAFSEDAFTQFRGRFDIGMVRAPLGSQLAFHCSLQHRSAIKLQLLSRLLQRGDAGV